MVGDIGQPTHLHYDMFYFYTSGLLLIGLHMDADPPESSALMINSDLMVVDWEDILCGWPRYSGPDWHDMMDTDSSDPNVRKRMDTADLVNMCRTVAQDHRLSDTDEKSDTDSVAELNCDAWDDACAGDYHNTLGNIQNPPTYKRRNDD